MDTLKQIQEFNEARERYKQMEKDWPMYRFDTETQEAVRDDPEPNPLTEFIDDFKATNRDLYEGTDYIATTEHDVVKEPIHYTRWKIEPITFIMRNGFEFWRGNIVKYVSRAGYKAYPGKSTEQSEIIDLEKVIRYAEMRINQLNGETKL